MVSFIIVGRRDHFRLRFLRRAHFESSRIKYLSEIFRITVHLPLDQRGFQLEPRQSHVRLDVVGLMPAIRATSTCHAYQYPYDGIMLDIQETYSARHTR